MRGLTFERAVEIVSEGQRDSAERYVDLCISLRVCDVDTSGPEPVFVLSTDEEILEIGERWDRVKQQGVGRSKSVRIVRVPRGSDQEQPARWLAEWFSRYLEGRKGEHWKRPREIPTKVTGKFSVQFRRVWTLLLAGGRRGGKSHLAVLSLVLMMLAKPKGIVWAVSPTQTETDELEQAAREILPSRWFSARGEGAGKSLTFTLANGSRILFLSGHKPRSLKRGRCDLALLNEAQNMYRATWRQLRGAIADRAGLVVIAANPADAEIGLWVDRLYKQAVETNELAVQAFHLVAKHNPMITAEALEDMRAEVDDNTAAREIDGKMGVPIGDVVLHAFTADNILDPYEGLVDITAEFVAAKLGRPAADVVGMDFQASPAMVGLVVRFFRDPKLPDEVLGWVVDEAYVAGTEAELVDALEAMPRWQLGDGAPDTRDPEHAHYTGATAVIADASGWWQDGAHTKGKTSDLALRAKKWTNLHRPQRDSDANPAISERMKAANARLCRAGVRRFFIARHCTQTAEAFRLLPNKNGQPDRRSPHAHGVDAATYVVYRFFGRPPEKTAKHEYRGLGRFSRASSLREAM